MSGHAATKPVPLARLGAVVGCGMPGGGCKWMMKWGIGVIRVHDEEREGDQLQRSRPFSEMSG